MTNIIDGMDAARWRSPHAASQKEQKKEKKEEKNMPQVLKNLKNGS